MTTTETASPHTSELTFTDSEGEFLGVPIEWTPCMLQIPVDPTRWASVTAHVNGRPMSVSARVVGGVERVVAEWERSGPGRYEIIAVAGDDEWKRTVKVDAAKISSHALDRLLSDLEASLPITVAVALRDAGAHIGVHLSDPAEQTLASEIARIRRAVFGANRPGLLAVLDATARDPHRMLTNVGVWTRRSQVRRPDGASLVQSLWKADNLESGLPKHLLDRRVVHTVDLYENRIVRAFTDEVLSRLRRLTAVLAETSNRAMHEEVRLMLNLLTQARRKATFLDEVGPLLQPPSRVTMVLLKRREYRAAYEGLLEFRKRFSVRLDEAALGEPLENLPYLYQVWGTLVVIRAVLEAASKAGFSVWRQQLVWPHSGGLYLSVLKDGQDTLVMRRGAETLRVVSERSYGKGGVPLRSMSFGQRPDIAVELEHEDGTVDVLLFDPKYKLDSEASDGGDGTPKKVDIDKMHAYRDAIRDGDGHRAVRYAATLYPGATKAYGPGLSALRAYPGEDEVLAAAVESVVSGWIGG